MSVLSLLNSLRHECNQIIEGQFEWSAERTKGAEGRVAAAGKQVAQRALVEASLSRQVTPRPATQNSRAIKRRNVNGPLSRTSHPGTSVLTRQACNGMHRLPAKEAMEGTVLRVPCHQPDHVQRHNP